MMHNVFVVVTRCREATAAWEGQRETTVQVHFLRLQVFALRHAEEARDYAHPGREQTYECFHFDFNVSAEVKCFASRSV